MSALSSIHEIEHYLRNMRVSLGGPFVCRLEELFDDRHRGCDTEWRAYMEKRPYDLSYHITVMYRNRSAGEYYAWNRVFSEYMLQDRHGLRYTVDRGIELPLDEWLRAAREDGQKKATFNLTRMEMLDKVLESLKEEEDDS